LLARLRGNGIASEISVRGNAKKRMARAAASGARVAIIVGDQELELGAAQVKDLASGEQRAVAFDLLEAAIRA
jgi:histidyl-tRNA synthetase